LYKYSDYGQPAPSLDIKVGSRCQVCGVFTVQVLRLRTDYTLTIIQDLTVEHSQSSYR